jgi:hypothetical protein
MSIHGLLAAELAIDKMAELSVWRDALPTLADFEATLPFMWHEQLQGLLPKPAGDILKKQQDNFHRDWSLVKKAFPDVRREDYLHSWFNIGTRTFYFVTPEMKKYPRDDRLAVVPMADFFNHAESGCEVTWSLDGGFVISTDRGYRAGQQIHISYGTHTNDFLLAEYGFVLAKNRWDEVCLDDVILPRLDATQKARLQDGGLLGPFMLNVESLGCEKTQAALRLLSKCCCTREQWHEVVDVEGCGEQSDCQEMVDAMLMSMLDNFLRLVRKTAQNVGELQVGQCIQRELLERRWEQIDTMVRRMMVWLEARRWVSVEEHA